jgi:hypothetical protein
VSITPEELSEMVVEKIESGNFDSLIGFLNFLKISKGAMPETIRRKLIKFIILNMAVKVQEDGFLGVNQ